MAETTKGSEIKARSRRVITTPGGLVIEIRKIGLDVIGQYRNAIPDVSVLGEDSEKLRDNLSRDPKALAKAVDAMGTVIRAGCVSPSFAEGNPDGLNPSDLELADQVYLFGQITELTGLTREAGKEVLPLSQGSA